MEIECVSGGFRVLGSAKNGIWDRMKTFLGLISKDTVTLLLEVVGIVVLLFS
ncbi:hypothetical protein [Marinifilum sp. D737]|uniref:hypothetical protein n=1 Tax=Marinifilum sp. D737 TaxID=2969628 RepID=UPI0022755B1F|nr:hypothetical protein [Marinifilum sp. D737]MCY1634311.1 hypothetical protein [Marinifilum sp. D737]